MVAAESSSLRDVPIRLLLAVVVVESSSLSGVPVCLLLGVVVAESAGDVLSLGDVTTPVPSSKLGGR